MRFLSFAAACLLLAGVRPATAQVTAVGLRDLAFGPVLQGVELHVLPTDVEKAGQFRLGTAAGSTLRLQFNLPTKLEGPTTEVLKIRFATTDGMVVPASGGDAPLVFDPSRPQTFTMTSTTTLNVFLGGIVTAAPNQSGGAYANTITLTVTVL